MYTSPRPYPFLPHGRDIKYVATDNDYLGAAGAARKPLLDRYPDAIVTSSILVKNGEIIGEGTNHPVHESFCPRTVFQSPSGQDYELCPNFCHADNHSEANAILNAKTNGYSTEGADLYLHGHWWLCEPCWDKINDAGIRQVYLMEGATEAFYRDVSPKGEPEQALSVQVDGTIPDDSLNELLSRVNITLTKDQGADYRFSPPPDASVSDFVLALHHALAKAGVYKKR